MPEFEIQCDYVGKRKMKFFNDKEPKEYHAFLVNNTEIIPDECLYFTGNKQPCWILILDGLAKRARIDFGNPYGGGINEHKFIINLGGEKVAKFNTENSNKMVLKTKDYFENTIKKIGFWGRKDYFYETKKKPERPTKKQNNGSTKTENQSDWGKIVFLCLPIVIVVFFIFLFIKSVSKRKKQ